MEKIPKSLSTSITVLKHDDRYIYLLGTAHVSRKSCDDAKLLIESVKPGIVFVELCERRSRLLEATDEELRPAPFSEMLKKFRNGEANLFSLVYSILLEKVAKDLEIIPGEEFRVAYQEALLIEAAVILGDRPVDITIKRVWMGLTLYQKIRFICQLIFSGINTPSPSELKEIIEKLRKETDLISETVQELGRTFPWIVESLINERDLYMVLSLRESLSLYPGDLVAVVGAGHLAGICRHWNTPSLTEQETTNIKQELLRYPGSPFDKCTLEDFRSYVKETMKKNKIALDIENKQILNSSPLKPLVAATYNPFKSLSFWSIDKRRRSYKFALSRKSITFISVTLFGIGSYALLNYYYGEKSNIKKDILINRYKS